MRGSHKEPAAPAGTPKFDPIQNASPYGESEWRPAHHDEPVMLALRVHLPKFSTRSRRKPGARVHSFGELQGSRRLRFPLRPLALISPKIRRNQGTREASATSWPDALPYFFCPKPGKKTGARSAWKNEVTFQDCARPQLLFLALRVRPGLSTWGQVQRRLVQAARVFFAAAV